MSLCQCVCISVYFLQVVMQLPNRYYTSLILLNDISGHSIVTGTADHD
jgi:hypothetical protein